MRQNTRSIPLKGEALRSARANAFLTQVALAKLAGTTGTTIFRLETGRQKCSLALLKRIGDVLAVDPNSLIES